MPNVLLSPNIGSFNGGRHQASGLTDVEDSKSLNQSNMWAISKDIYPKREKKMISPILRESSDGKPQSNRWLSRSITSPEIPLKQMTRSPRSDTELSNAGLNNVQAGHSASSASDGVIGIIQAENIMKEKIRRRYTDIRDAFQTLDLQRSFTVSVSDFRRVIHAFCVQLSDDQFNHLLVKIGSKKDSMINYISFLEKFRTGPVFISSEAKHLNSPVPRTADQRQESFEEVENRMRIKLSTSLSNFLKAVRLFDYNRDGHVQRNELKRCLDSACFKLSDANFEKLLQKFDITRGSHSIEYMDFLRRLGVDTRIQKQQNKGNQQLFLDRPSKSREQSKSSSFSNTSKDLDALIGLKLPQVEKKFREKMIQKFADVKRAFVAFDNKRDGFVTLDELKRVLINFLFPMSDQMFSQLMERCGVRASHKIPYDHFLDKFKSLGQEGNGQTIPIVPSHKVNPIREAESPLEMKEVWTRLKSHILSNYSSIKKAFLVFDDDKDGRVNRKEFRKVLKTFPFQITSEQFKEVMRRVDPDGNGYISYHQFLNTFETREGQGAHPWLSNERKVNQAIPMPAVDRQRAEDILRTKIMDNWKSIAKAFTKVDENSDGFISAKELKTLLYRFHLQISEHHFKDLWARCDINSDGMIQYDEFMKQLGVDITSGDISGISSRITDESEEKIQLMKDDQMLRLQVASKNAFSRTTQMDAKEVIKVLRDHISRKSSDFRKTFLQYDYDGDGKLSKKEFRMTLENLGLLMHDDQYKELTKRIGFFKGKLSYSDFLERFEDIERFGEGGKTMHLDNHRFNKIIERSESMNAEEVEVIMRKKIHESFQSLRQAFYSVDSNHDAHITRPEFRRLLDMFMIPINDAEFDRLMTEKLNIAKNGTISYKEFIKRFQQNENFQKGHPWLFSDQNVNSTPALPSLSAKEANTCLKKKATDQWHDISTAFRAFDKDGNSIVTKAELRSILHRFNIFVDLKEFRKLWRMYDIDKNGYVDHDEFLRRLGVEFAPGDVNGISNKITKESEDEIYRHFQSQKMKHERATINQANTTAFMSALDVEKQLRDKFRDNYASFRKAFEQVDANKNGVVSKKELLRVLEEHHFYMNDKELTNLLIRIGFANNESLSYKHFLSAFEDPRLSGNSKLTLDSPVSLPGRVTFDSAEDLTPEEAIVKLRKKVAQNENSIRNAFGAFDSNGSGCIKKDDLHMIINSFCFKITDRQFKYLLTKLNVQPNGTVDCESFIESFQKSDAEASNRWMENLLRKDSTTSPKQFAAAVPSYDVMEERMADMIQARCNRILKAFSDTDPERSGRVPQDVLYQVLSEHTLRLNKEHFNKLWDKFDQNYDGTISYRDFLRYFAGNNVNITAPTMQNQFSDENLPNEEACSDQFLSNKTVATQEKPLTPLHTWRSAGEIENEIKSQNFKNYKGLAKSFKEADLQDTGEITYNQFKAILGSFQVLLSDEEATILARKYDIDNRGRVNYVDFIRRNTPDANNNTNDARPRSPTKPSMRTDNEFLNSLMSRMRREMHSDWKAIRRAFKATDRFATGMCSTIEARQMLRKFTVELNEEEFYHLMSYFDKNMTGQLAYNEFLKVLQ